MNVENRDPQDQTILQEMLRELRANAGMRQSDLAHKLGVTQSMVSKYEVGERRLDVLEIRNICRLLGITLVEFADKLERRLDKK